MQPFDAPKYRIGFHVNPLASRCGAHAARATLRQHHARRLFELGNLETERGLRHVRDLGGRA